MFEGWDSFYLIIGGGAGALIGLMFVVATLGAGRDRAQSLRNSAIYMTPTVASFTTVMVVSALSAAPRLTREAVAAILGAIAVSGMAYGVLTVLRMRRGRPPHWSDYWCYGYGPPAFYAALGIAAAAAGLGADWAPRAIAAVLLSLLLLAIRNAWDLVTWLAPGGETGGAAPDG